MSRRKFLFGLAVVTSALCLLVRFLAPGWLIFLLLVPSVALAVAHVFVHRVAIRRSPSLAPGWFLVSNAALLLGFLLQYDAGDSSGWLVINVVLGDSPGSYEARPPSWWPDTPWMDLWVFLPYAVATGMLLHWTRRRGKAA